LASSKTEKRQFVIATCMDSDLLVDMSLRGKI
jgi:hypothetical protein